MHKYILYSSLFLVLSCVFIGAAAPALEQEGEARPKVLILLDRGFNRQEFYQFYGGLRALGYITDIVAPERGTVYLSNDGVPDSQGRDAEANRSLGEIEDVHQYQGLVMIGGYAPGHLEAHPEVFTLLNAFLEADLPIAAICHAPRLLMRAGVLRNRAMACWHEVSNELPDMWNSPERGFYIDAPVVRDGNLMTSRYPNDTTPQFQAFAQLLAQRGGLPFPERSGHVIILAPNNDSGHIRWLWTMTLRMFGNQVHVLHAESNLGNLFGEDFSSIPENLRAVIAVQDPDLPSWLGEEGLLSDLLAQHEVPILEVEASYTTQEAYIAPLYAMLNFAREQGQQQQEPPQEAYTAAIALSEGFDEAVVATMRAALEAQGRSVALLAARRGWIRGLNGMPVEALYTYAEAPQLSDQAIIVAPGGLWPEKQEDARQAEIPDWIEEQAERDAARLAWMLDHYDQGRELITFGFDSLRVGRHEQFAGKSFSTTEQAQWSFGRGAGRYSAEPISESAPRLLSVRGAQDLYRVLQRMLVQAQEAE